MEKLDYSLLASVKRAFVTMPSGSDPSLGSGPVAGGGMLTQAQASPMGGTPQMDPSMMGGDPAAAGMDPSMMGVDPAAAGMDPSMAGGAPAAGPIDPTMGGQVLDPSMMANAASAAPSGSQIVLSVPDFIQIISAISGMSGKGGSKKPAGESGQNPAASGQPSGGGTDQKLDQIIQLLSGAGQMPPMQ